jgi:hypothetical protein
LAQSRLDDQRAARSKQARRLRDQGTIAVKPVGAAVEREVRIVIANLSGKSCDVGRADIRWVRHDQIERAV